MLQLEASGPAQSIYDLSFDALVRELAPLSPTHAATLWRALYRDAETTFATQRDFLPPLRRWVDGMVGPGRPLSTEGCEVAAATASGDCLTRKYLLRFADGATAETVLMGYPGRFTACISTQVGCAMGCVFCATGQMGFTRHLRAGEIVGQVLHVHRALAARGDRLRNLVLMGMGEPLHNYDHVMQALAIVSDRGGLNIGPRRITVNTVGIVPAILRMAREQQPYNLGVSLHGSTEAERAALVPVSHRWPLDELIAACRTYTDTTHRRVFLAWTL